MSTPCCNAASKLASVLPGSMCAAPLWPTRRIRLSDGSIIASTMAESRRRCRISRRLAAPACRRRSDGAWRPAGAVDALQRATTAEVWRQHGERELVREPWRAGLPVAGHVARDDCPDRAGDGFAGHQRPTARTRSALLEQLGAGFGRVTHAADRRRTDFVDLDQRDPGERAVGIEV